MKEGFKVILMLKKKWTVGIKIKISKTMAKMTLNGPKLLMCVRRAMCSLMWLQECSQVFYVLET